MSQAAESVGPDDPRERSACSGWNNGDCTGTPHCPPRCPRFVADDGTTLLVLPFDTASLRDIGALDDASADSAGAMDEAVAATVGRDKSSEGDSGDDSNGDARATTRERTLDALLEMYDAFDDGSQTLGLPPTTPEATRRWLTSLTEQGWNLLAWDGEAVVGHIGLVPGEGEEMENELIVFVHPEYQGRGLGTELMRQAIAYAAAGRIEALRLSVSQANRGAIHVYQNVEFEIDERVPSALEMRLDLDAPIASEVRKPPATR